MFGISWAEFLVVLLVAVLVIPTRHWPDVARFLGRVVRWVRNLVWKITDVSENLRDQIELQRPIDDLIRTTTDEVLDAFSAPRRVAPAKKHPKQNRRAGKKRGRGDEEHDPDAAFCRITSPRFVDVFDFRVRVWGGVGSGPLGPGIFNRAIADRVAGR